MTHLIVGEYDTAKYRHVARERPDIKPMAAAWINAVRSHWVNDQDFDFRKLESQHHLKTFESSGGLPLSTVAEERERQKLLICLTGFEEQDRHYIEEAVVANGGNYMGDLSRKVTHLIVCNPEGKKYQAAKNWNITTVSIEWLTDSVQRGMILDEVCYDPILPKEDRGKGAIVKKEINRLSVGGKRTRESSDPALQTGPRKLRKSASMRLSNQGNNLLNEIFNNKQPPPEESRPALEQRSVSVSVLPTTSRPGPGPEPIPKTLPIAGVTPSLPQATGDPTQAADGVFAYCRCMIHGFSEKKSQMVYDFLTSHGGRIADSMENLKLASHHEPQDQRFLVVPQNSRPESHPAVPEGIHIVTEFFIERCIYGRRLIHPDDHVLGRPFPCFPIEGFENLVIHSTGFKDEQLNQVEKAIVQLGAKYAERFSAQTSVMMCPNLKDVRTGKLDLALRNKIPVVHADWLWQCISAGYQLPWDKFVFPEVQHRVSIDVDPDLDKRRQKLQRSRSEPVRKKEIKAELCAPATKATVDPTVFEEDALPAVAVDNSVLGGVNKESMAPVNQEQDPAVDVTNYHTAPTQQEPDSSVAGPLSELGRNALNKPPKDTQSEPAHREPLRRFPTGGTIGDSEAGDESDAPIVGGDSTTCERKPTSPQVSKVGRHKHKAVAVKDAERRAMAEQLTTLMDKPGGTDLNNAHISPATATKHQRRKREVLGRAVSNVSAASSASAESAITVSKPVRMDSTKSAPGSNGLVDEMLSGEHGLNDKAEQVVRPPATQIGYDDPHARKHREELMDRIQGKKKDTGGEAKIGHEQTQKLPGPQMITSTAASRRPRRKGF